MVYCHNYVDPVSDCIRSETKPECTCTAVWKCKMCSRFEMVKKLSVKTKLEKS